MNDATPIVSIGMPVFNAANFLEQALRSISGQTFAEWELIICDNASTDCTQAICESWAARDPRITYTRNDRNHGAAYSYNRTFDMARGKYFKWAAHDDLISPNFLASCVDLLERHPDTVVAYTPSVFIDEHGGVIQNRREPHDLTAASPSARFSEMITHMGHCIPIFGLMRAEALGRTRKHGAFPHADRVTLLELILQGPFREASEATFYLRQHPGTSLRANPDARSLWLWFDTAAQVSKRHTFLRLTQEKLTAVKRSDVSGWQKLRCYLRVGRFAISWMVPAVLAKLRRLVGR